jgi:hypothetical protein
VVKQEWPGLQPLNWNSRVSLSSCVPTSSARKPVRRSQSSLLLLAEAVAQRYGLWKSHNCVLGLPKRALVRRPNGIRAPIPTDLTSGGSHRWHASQRKPVRRGLCDSLRAKRERAHGSVGRRLPPDKQGAAGSSPVSAIRRKGPPWRATPRPIRRRTLGRRPTCAEASRGGRFGNVRETYR